MGGLCKNPDLEETVEIKTNFITLTLTNPTEFSGQGEKLMKISTEDYV